MQTPPLVKEPIIEAVIEARFPGDARVEYWRGQYQQKIRGEYSKMYVPRVALSTPSATALLHYRFFNESETHFVAIAPNSLAYGSTQYPGWQAFRQEFLKHWNAVEGELQPTILTRLGMRFTNSFQSEAVGETTENLDALAQIRFEQPYLRVLETKPAFHQSVTSFKRGEHQIVVNVLLQENGAELQIGYDLAVMNVAPNETPRIIDELHTALEAEFFGSIAEDLAQGLKPLEGGRTE